MGFNPFHILNEISFQNWLRNRNTVELLGFWETIYNPNFKPVEFDGFRKQNTIDFIGIWESIYNPNFNYGEFAIIKSKVRFKLIILKVPKTSSCKFSGAGAGFINLFRPLLFLELKRHNFVLYNKLLYTKTKTINLKLSKYEPLLPH